MTLSSLILAALVGLVLGRLLRLAAARLAQEDHPQNPDGCLKAEALQVFRRPSLSLWEPVGALAAVALWVRFPDSPLLWVYIPFVGLLLVLTHLDLRYQWLPDLLTLPGLALGLGLALVFPHTSFLQSLLGALAGGLIFQGVRWLYGLRRAPAPEDLPCGLGGGDVKLLALIGAFLGLKCLPLVLLLSGLLGGVVGLIMLLGRWRRFRDAFPYGPCLTAAALLALVIQGP